MSVPLLPASPETIAIAAERLRAGGLVAFPTETVYGLGADATSDAAVAAIFAAKGRPQFNPLISHVPDRAAARALGVFDDLAERLAEAFWPGPLTLVVPRAAACSVSLLASAGLPTLALRVPAHGVAQALLRATGRPIAAPSANHSGTVSPTEARHVAESLGEAAGLILDAGPCTAGLESTIVGVFESGARLLRLGAIPREAIADVTGPVEGPDDADAEAPQAPGALLRHYAPARPLRLDASAVEADEALLAFGPSVPQGARVTINLSPTGDLIEAAARFFAALHALDRADVRAIAAMAIPDKGLGEAINDRLRRAARGR
ncbi:MAG: threonylcarbamoyl-AMP synthase [Alphaproteobacteria bacterium]|nr:threonylcarbamoyl-AMP synthase [Alphaproteobacteria bacterium]